jgi:hypothetical protein
VLLVSVLVVPGLGFFVSSEAAACWKIGIRSSSLCPHCVRQWMKLAKMS